MDSSRTFSDDEDRLIYRYTIIAVGLTNKLGTLTHVRRYRAIRGVINFVRKRGGGRGVMSGRHSPSPEKLIAMTWRNWTAYGRSLVECEVIDCHKRYVNTTNTGNVIVSVLLYSVFERKRCKNSVTFKFETSSVLWKFKNSIGSKLAGFLYFFKYDKYTKCNHLDVIIQCVWI